MMDRCSLTFGDDETALVSTEVPAACMASLRPTPRNATLREEVGEILFVGDPYVEVRGARLGISATDVLPVDPAAPRVFDNNGDGHSGMSVSVQILGIAEGATYALQRVRYTRSGREISAYRLDGTIEWSDERAVLEAHNPLLMGNTVGHPEPDPAKHRLAMVRVEEPSTCEQLYAYRGELLGFVELAGGL